MRPMVYAPAPDTDDLTQQALDLLAAWANASERWWYDIPGEPGLGCYGTGYDSWGVQTNQKYAAAMAMLAAHRRDDVGERALRRSLAAMRFSLATHHSGPARCTDGRKWGHTWISALGVERMMHAVAAIDDHLTDVDRADLRRVLTSEADWIHHRHRRGHHEGVFGDPWNHTGKNVPESNLWNGALLWRTAAMYPDHPDVEAWRERAHEFLINSVSVPADAQDDRMVAGKPIRKRFRGANFFPNYALDHHAYLNVGYMVICVSNAAMLHFDLKRQGLERPDSLDHHQNDLWQVLRRMVFGDARLARIGGDTRLRYTYCQEYLLPALLYAADHLGDAHALPLVARQMEMIRRESDFNGDGSFYGKRLRALPQQSPYYYTRLESDRANVLGMLLAYLPLTQDPAEPAADEPFEASVQGGWHEPEHGAVMHRCPTRLASFAWRAQGLAQGLCLPPNDGSLAEWFHNLAGTVRMVGDQGHRRLLDCHTEIFAGGFATCGSVMEGVDLVIPEGWRATDSAVHQIAFAALPDGHTVVGMQHCRGTDRRIYTAEIKGMQLGIPNDLFNGFERRLATAAGNQALTGSPPHAATSALESRWANVDGRIGVVGVYGAQSLSLSRSDARRGGPFQSLFVEELCWGNEPSTRAWDAGAVMLDVGWVVLSEADAAATRRLAESGEVRQLDLPQPDVRGISLPGMDGRRYVVVANFGPEHAAVEWSPGQQAQLPPGRAMVKALDEA